MEANLTVTFWMIVMNLDLTKATFSAILEWGLENFLELLEHHAGAHAEEQRDDWEILGWYL